MVAARVLVIDLNNFARYPTIPIGYIASILRSAGCDVEVFSPLSAGVKGVVREKPLRRWSLLEANLRMRSAFSISPLTRVLRRSLARLAGSQLLRRIDRIHRRIIDRLDRGRFDCVLISTYLMYRNLCERIAGSCKERGVPVIIGGPYFVQAEVARCWLPMSGVAAIAASEVELRLPAIVEGLVDRSSLGSQPGLWMTDDEGHLIGGPTAPLTDLDRLPFPDYSDFPWQLYPNRIIPIISGRGCGWGVCKFCSDVTSTAGRSFRSRSPGKVLEEIGYQSARHDARLFVLTDLKLNSEPVMWESIIGGFRTACQEGRWICSMHMGKGPGVVPTGAEWEAARASGLVRITTGLESGSQRVLDLMSKGTSLERVSSAIRGASDAGISVRATMIVGYPGEEEGDVRESARFLRDHFHAIDRVLVNRFQVMTGTPMEREILKYPNGIKVLKSSHEIALLEHTNEQYRSKAYRRSVYDLLAAAHQINAKSLKPAAKDFLGVM